MYKLCKVIIKTLQSVSKVSIHHIFEGIFFFINFRCVEGFDHHCMWINNCIGSNNYQYFIMMTTATFLNMVVYIVGMVLLWAEG